MAHEGKEFICNSGGTGDVDLIPGSGKWELAPIILFFIFFLLEKSHGQQSLVGYSPKGYKESDTTE